MTWVEIARRWHDTGVTNCNLCGKLIPRRVWTVEIAAKQLGFCSQDCERLYRTYWLPKYGNETPAAKDAMLSTHGSSEEERP